MNFLQILHFLTFIICLYLAVYVLIKNIKSPLHRVLSLLLLCFCIWSYGKFYTDNPTTSKETVKLLIKTGSFGWCSFPSLFLLFSIIFTKQKKLFKNIFFIITIFIPPVFFVYKQLTNSLVIDTIKQQFGWSFVWSKTILPYLFILYITVFMLVGFYLIFTFGEKTSDRTKKIQSKIIFYTALLALSIGIITDFVLPKLYFYIIPPLGDVVILIWIMGLVYSITKYEFLITPATASKNIISTMSDSLILINQEGNIIDINKSTINLLGYSKNQLIDKHIQMLFSDNNLTTVLFDKTSKEGCLVNQKVILKKNTGEDIITLFSCSALKDEFGTIVGFVCTITDITESEKRKEELRKAKEEIEKKNEKLMQINEMKSEFLSMVSHEIKTPLTIMKEFISIVLDRIPGEINETQEEYLNIAYNNINRLEVIVNDLLDISKLEAGKMKLSLTLFDISTLIKDTVTAFNSKLKSNKIELNYFLQKPLPKVYADPTRISQVLNNLVENAFKYTPDGGKITIGAVLKNSFIEISVTDTGPGIPPEDLDKIFDRFEQLGQSPRTVTKSAGLGLSISKKIVELSGGKIWAESPVKDGKGSKFTFTLPKAS